MARSAPNGITIARIRDKQLDTIIERQPVDAREIVASDPKRYELVDAEGAAVESLEKSAEVSPLITSRPHEFAQAIITGNVESGAEMILKLIEDVDTPLSVKRDALARALELEEASKARKTLLDILRDAQKQAE